MEEILIILLFGFIAAFIDSIAGGGGLISVPALLSIGLPPSIALGTNKIQSTISSAVSSIGYLKSGKIDKKLLLSFIPFTLLGSAIGVFLVKLMPSEWLRPIIIILLILMLIYTLIKKNWGSFDNYKELNKKTFFIIVGLIFIIGIYDGFFGPGTGSFLVFIFLFTGMDFLRSQANAKILNTISNFVALIVFMFFGLLNYKFGLIMSIGGIFGAYFGTKFAVKKGSAIVKPIFIIITLFLIAKQVFEYFS